MHTDAHLVKNNQQPPISFWHPKEGTLKKKKKKHKMLRQIVLHTFSSGIYTMPFPSCLHLHIYIAQSLPPTVLQCSCQLICWPSSEAALMAGQRMAAKNYYKIVVVCVYFKCALSQFSQSPHSHAWAVYLLLNPNIMESVHLWNLQMNVQT